MATDQVTLTESELPKIPAHARRTRDEVFLSARQDGERLVISFQSVRLGKTTVTTVRNVVLFKNWFPDGGDYKWAVESNRSVSF